MLVSFYSVFPLHVPYDDVVFLSVTASALAEGQPADMGQPAASDFLMIDSAMSIVDKMDDTVISLGSIP